MTPEFNAWWDSDDIAAENPYDIEKPIYWAWEGWQAARKREWKGLTNEEIVNCPFMSRFTEDAFATIMERDLIQFARQIENKLRAKNA